MPKDHSPTDDVEEFDTIRDVARAWKVSHWTVRRYINEGRLKVHRLGDHTVRISRKERSRFEQEAVDA
jgi:excisionase family DNA binding protein